MKVIFEREKEREPYLTLKGGSWFGLAQSCLAAYRFGGVPGFRNYLLGFRPLIRIRRLE